VERRTVKVGKKVETRYRVKLVSKATAMTLAARHQLGDKLNVSANVNTIDWDQLTAALLDVPVPGEARAAAAGLPCALKELPTNKPAQSLNGIGTRPS
jgi:hypothetical protein